MTRQYSLSLKKEITQEICVNGKSTLKTAQDYGIPLKTVEKWITAFNKDRHCFDSSNKKSNLLIDYISSPDSYDNMSIDELKKELIKRDIQLARLQKEYLEKEKKSTLLSNHDNQ